MAAGCANMDPEEMYAVDLFTGAREDALDKTMAESYVRTATEISKMNGNGTDFFSKYGEAMRVLRHLADHGTADQVATKLLDLHKRHARQVCAAIDAAVGTHTAEMREGKLPETCLIALAWDKKYRQRVSTPKKPLQRFPTPAGTAWEQVSIRVLDGESITIKVNGISEVHTFHGMGMINSKNGRPDKQWQLLINFGNAHGHLTWHSPDANRKNQKRKELLSKRLREFFDINDEPFVLEGGGWKTRFQITPPA